MKSSIAVVAMLLLAITALSIGLSFAEKAVSADEKMNATANNTTINESLKNATAANMTLNNLTASNGTLLNASATNCTLENATTQQNATNPFSNVKGRQIKK